MKVAIFPSAYNDLADGYDFYERQGEGLGDYFEETLLSVIDSLRLYGEYISRCSDVTGCSQSAFRTACIIIWKTRRSRSGRFSTADKTRLEFVAG